MRLTPHCTREHYKVNTVILVFYSGTALSLLARRLSRINKEDLVSTDFQFHLHCDLVYQASEYDSFKEDITAKEEDVCNDYLKTDGQAQFFCPVI